MATSTFLNVLATTKNAFSNTLYILGRRRWSLKCSGVTTFYSRLCAPSLVFSLSLSSSQATVQSGNSLPCNKSITEAGHDRQLIFKTLFPPAPLLLLLLLLILSNTLFSIVSLRLEQSELCSKVDVIGMPFFTREWLNRDTENSNDSLFRALFTHALWELLDFFLKVWLAKL